MDVKWDFGEKENKNVEGGFLLKRDDDGKLVPATCTVTNVVDWTQNKALADLSESIKEQASANKMLARSLTDLGSCIRSMVPVPQPIPKDDLTDEEENLVQNAIDSLKALRSKGKEK